MSASATSINYLLRGSKVTVNVRKCNFNSLSNSIDVYSCS